jgi:hypothetical protein
MPTAGPPFGGDSHFGGNELDQRISHGDAAEEDAEKIEESGQHHGLARRERFCVDHGGGGIGRVVKTVGGLEHHHHHEAEDQQRDRESGGRVEVSQHPGTIASNDDNGIARPVAAHR